MTTWNTTGNDYFLQKVTTTYTGQWGGTDYTPLYRVSYNAGDDLDQETDIKSINSQYNGNIYNKYETANVVRGDGSTETLTQNIVSNTSSNQGSFHAEGYSVTIYRADGTNEVVQFDSRMDIGFFTSNANGGQYMMSFFHTDDDRIAYRTALDSLESGDRIVLNTGVVAGFSANKNNASVCFTRDTLILTEDGQKPICEIKVGDMVMTMDRGLQPVRWIGHSIVPASQLKLDEKVRPVLISKGSLGEGLPQRDLMVSRQHRMLLSIDGDMSDDVSRNNNQVMVAAKYLVGKYGIDLVEPKGDIEYWHILLGSHEAIFAEGVPAESLFLGAEALKALQAEHLIEICETMQLTDLSQIENSGFTPCRPFLEGKAAKGLELAVEDKSVVFPI